MINVRRGLMRKVTVCVAFLLAGATASAPSALAAPVVQATAKIIPIAGFPGTGNILGAGAALQINATATGTESAGGVVSQLRKVVVFLPKGVTVNPKPFPTCSAALLESRGPAGCPKNSAASPVGSAGVVDPIAGELVKESATLQAFFAPGGGLNFYTNAASPISAQLVVQGHYQHAPAPYGLMFTTNVPLVESVPGAPPVSTTSINLKVGAAIRKGKKTFYYGKVPTTCPHGGFTGKFEATFQTGETVTHTVTVPCPTRSIKHK
jgi:hypothetical protein